MVALPALRTRLPAADRSQPRLQALPGRTSRPVPYAQGAAAL